MAMKTFKALYKFIKIIDYLYFQVGPPLGDVSTQRRKKMKINFENENEKKRIQKKERIKDILVIALKKLTLSDTNIRRLILKTSISISLVSLSIHLSLTTTSTHLSILTSTGIRGNLDQWDRVRSPEIVHDQSTPNLSCNSALNLFKQNKLSKYWQCFHEQNNVIIIAVYPMLTRMSRKSLRTAMTIEAEANLDLVSFSEMISDMSMVTFTMVTINTVVKSLEVNDMMQVCGMPVTDANLNAAMSRCSDFYASYHKDITRYMCTHFNTMVVLYKFTRTAYASERSSN